MITHLEPDILECEVKWQTWVCLRLLEVMGSHLVSRLAGGFPDKIEGEATSAKGTLWPAAVGRNRGSGLRQLV